MISADRKILLLLNTLFGILLSSVLFFSLPTAIGYAQIPEPAIEISSFDTRNFPEIEVNFKVLNPVDEIRPNPANATVFEDGKLLKPDTLTKLYSGVHFTLVINPEYSLTLRWGNGQQYYPEFIEAVQSIGPDVEHPDANRFSLYINPDLSTVEIANYDAWVNAIDDYQENQRNMSSSLDSLNLAITALENSSLSLDSVLVYLTPYLEPSLLPEFFRLVERAAAIDLSMHVWIVMDQGMLGTSYETNLQEALQATGGSLSSFTGSEEIPDPNKYLIGKGTSYRLNYQSQVRESGLVDLAVEVKTDESGNIRSNPINLDIQVEPAQLSFINPPERLELLRDNEGTISPATLPLEVLIEFPDGYPRGIVSSTLYVNGVRSQTNQVAPYGSFVIDLNALDDQDELRLEVRLEDVLGLQGKTAPQTISLDIFEPESPYTDVWYANPWLWLVLMALAGVIAFVIFRKPGVKSGKKPSKEKQTSEAREDKAEHSPAAQTFVALKSFGSLMKLDPDQSPSAEKPQLLVKEVTLIGRDAGLANLVLDDPSLEPLHAEIHFFPDGRIRITDYNSTSGTYVNFKPVTTHGTSLQHADLIHFGSMLFRFNSSTRTQSGLSTPEVNTNGKEQVK